MDAYAHNQARRAELERVLMETQADQGGEASFADWLEYTADNDDEFMHEEAVELVTLYGTRLPARIVKTRRSLT